MKPYVILMLTTLKVREFGHKDEWETAIAALQAQDAAFIPLKWHAGASRYSQPELVTW